MVGEEIREASPQLDLHIAFVRGKAHSPKICFERYPYLLVFSG